jgi:hypothetical protein
MQRWQKVLKPGTRRGLWCPEEDAQLVAVVQAGGRTWKQVAQLLGGRTSKQCRERWCNHLDPSIKREPFSAAEDDLLLNQHALMGNRWSTIARMLAGRTEDAVKIRWKTLQRQAIQSGKALPKPDPEVLAKVRPPTKVITQPASHVLPPRDPLPPPLNSSRSTFRCPLICLLATPHMTDENISDEKLRVSNIKVS